MTLFAKILTGTAGLAMAAVSAAPAAAQTAPYGGYNQGYNSGGGGVGAIIGQILARRVFEQPLCEPGAVDSVHCRECARKVPARLPKRKCKGSQARRPAVAGRWRAKRSMDTVAVLPVEEVDGVELRAAPDQAPGTVGNGRPVGEPRKGVGKPCETLYPVADQRLLVPGTERPQRTARGTLLETVLVLAERVCPD